MALEELLKKLGFKFKNLQLLEVALTHRSFLNENRARKLEHNERLEFLGDAVLELVVTEHLYRRYPHPEGVLTNWRSALVKTDSLAAAAHSLGLERHLKLSRGEAKGSDRARHQILANTLEAVIGAIYLDQGYERSREFIDQHLIRQLPGIIKSGSWQDPKTKYQESAQEKEGRTPIYKVLKETGPDHDKHFTVGVYIGRELRGQGDGSSKQDAEQAAAAAALEKY